MFINQRNILPIDLTLNPKYIGSTTWCRLKKNDMLFTIKKVDGINMVTIDYEVIFETLTNCETVASALFQLVTSFDVTKHKDDDLIGITHLFAETYLQAEKFLKNEKNIPPAMIRTPTPLISSYDIDMLANDFLLELTKQGFYSEN